VEDRISGRAHPRAKLCCRWLKVLEQEGPVERCLKVLVLSIKGLKCGDYLKQRRISARRDKVVQEQYPDWHCLHGLL
jgi:hypothetical protein